MPGAVATGVRRQALDADIDLDLVRAGRRDRHRAAEAGVRGARGRHRDGDRRLRPGHSTQDERGTTEYNLALGQRRASVARKYLLNLGVDPAQLATVSFGKEKPADPRHTEEAWDRVIETNLKGAYLRANLS